MVEVTFYSSFEEMMEAEENARRIADSLVRPWQEKCRAGDILVSDPGYGFPVFHEILDNEKIVGENLKKYGDDYEDEGVHILDLYREPYMRNYRFCRNYSVVVPEGELGDIHLSIALAKVYRDAFEKLRDNGFRMDED